MLLVDPEENKGIALVIPMEQQDSGEDQESKYDGDVDIEIVPQSRTGKRMQVYYKIPPPNTFGGKLSLGDNRIGHLTRLMKRSKFGHVTRLM